MEEQREAAPQSTMPFMDKVVNVFAAPGELYENVRSTPKTTSNWLVPAIVLICVSIVLSQVMLTNASLNDQIGQATRKAMEQAVQQGRITQEQADQQIERIGPGSVIFTIGTTVGPLIFTFLRLFLIALVLWLLGKSAMKAQAPYMKVVEVVGLTLFISVLEAIVTTILAFAMDSITATPSLGAFVSNFDFGNKMHMALAKVNIFTFWIIAVTSIGLSKLFQRDLPKVLVLVVALWIIWAVVSLFTGLNFG